MKIENLKDLEQLIKLCRRLGVDAFEVGQIKFGMGQEPQPKSRAKKTLVANDFPEATIQIPQYNPLQGGGTAKSINSGMPTTDTIKTNALTPEQLLFYSAVGENQAEG